MRLTTDVRIVADALPTLVGGMLLFLGRYIVTFSFLAFTSIHIHHSQRGGIVLDLSRSHSWLHSRFNFGFPRSRFLWISSTLSPEDLLCRKLSPSRSGVVVSAAGEAIKLLLHALVCRTRFSSFSAAGHVPYRVVECVVLAQHSPLSACLLSRRYTACQPKDISYHFVCLVHQCSSLWVFLNNGFVLWVQGVTLLQPVLFKMCVQVSHFYNTLVLCVLFALRRTWRPCSSSPLNLLFTVAFIFRTAMSTVQTSCWEHYPSLPTAINSVHFTSRSVTRQRDWLSASPGSTHSPPFLLAITQSLPESAEIKRYFGFHEPVSSFTRCAGAVVNIVVLWTHNCKCLFW
jgi:hypothetical protein